MWKCPVCQKEVLTGNRDFCPRCMSNGPAVPPHVSTPGYNPALTACGGILTGLLVFCLVPVAFIMPPVWIVIILLVAILFNMKK
jgi:hypothetical protein